MQKMTPAEAFAAASQWGSYITSSDPGAAFYRFRANDGRPVSEAHREELKTACVIFLSRLWGTTNEQGLKDGRELLNLWHFFHETELHPSAASA